MTEPKFLGWVKQIVFSDSKNLKQMDFAEWEHYALAVSADLKKLFVFPLFGDWRKSTKKQTTRNLGEVISITYLTDLWTGTAKLYKHTFEKSRPFFSDPKKRKFAILGGREKLVTKKGIVG